MKPGRHRARPQRHDDRDHQHRRRGPARARATASRTPSSRAPSGWSTWPRSPGRPVTFGSQLRRALRAPTTSGAELVLAAGDRAGEDSGGCRCTRPTPRASRAATPTSSTRSRTARRARSSPPSSCKRFTGDVPWAHLDIAGVMVDRGRAVRGQGRLRLRHAHAARGGAGDGRPVGVPRDLDHRLREAAAAGAAGRAPGAGVERVIDVRYRPQSRRPGMSKTRLGDLLAEHGIAYEHRRALGTPPDIRWLFKNRRVAEGREQFRATSRRRPPRSWTPSPPSSTPPRAPPSSASRPSPATATAASSSRRSASAARPHRRRPLTSRRVPTPGPGPFGRVVEGWPAPRPSVRPVG